MFRVLATVQLDNPTTIETAEVRDEIS